jgi:RNA polymerase sigma factor (sigma-70 family)
MADDTLHTVLRQLRRLAAANEGCALSDAQLLARVVDARDEAAFEVLVWRYGPLVLGTCRKLLHHTQDVEDAFQATFLTLARKAVSIRQRPLLSHWLYQVACRAARRLRQQAHRRQQREQPLHDVAALAAPADPAAGLEQRERWRAVLEELERLPVRYREPLIACYLQGLTHAEAAGALGRPVGSMSKLLARGCDLLRERLEARGIGLSAGALVALMAERAIVTLAPPLAAATVTAALQYSAGAALSGSAVSLANGVLRNMALIKLRNLACVFLTVAVLGGGTAGVTHQALARRANSAPEEQQAAAPAQAPDKKDPRLDIWGDPLPVGVVARLGTVRFRPVTALANLFFSPDGKTVISMSPRAVQVWDVATGREVRRLSAPEGSGLLPLATMLNDGRVLVMSMGNASVGPRLRKGPRLGDLASGEWQSLEQPVPAPKFFRSSPDGKVFAIAGNFDRLPDTRPLFRRPEGNTLPLRLYNVATNEQLFEATIQRVGQSPIVFSTDSKVAVLCEKDNALVLREVATGKELQRFTTAGGSNQRFDLAPNGKMLVSVGGDDGEPFKVQRWELPSGKPLPTVTVNPPMWYTVTFSPDSKSIAITAREAGIILLDAETGKERHRWRMDGQMVRPLAFSPDGATLAAAAVGTGVFSLWDTATGQHRTLPAKGNPSEVQSVAVPDDGTVVTLSGEELGYWNIATGRELRRSKIDLGPQAHPRALAPDGKTAAISMFGETHTLRLWDIAGKRALQDVTTKPIQAFHFAPDGKTAAVTYRSGGNAFWDLVAGRELRELDTEDRRTAKAWMLDGTLFMMATNLGVNFRKVTDGRQVGSLAWAGPRFTAMVPDALALSPNRKMLACAQEDVNGVPTITIYELASEKLRLRLTGHMRPVRALAWGTNHRTLVSGSEDTTALVWDLLAAAQVHPEAVTPEWLEAIWTTLLTNKAEDAFLVMAALAQSAEGVAFLGKRLAETNPDPAKPSAEWLRWQRGLEALELANTPQTRELLQALERLPRTGRLVQRAKLVPPLTPAPDAENIENNLSARLENAFFFGIIADQGVQKSLKLSREQLSRLQDISEDCRDVYRNVQNSSPRSNAVIETERELAAEAPRRAAELLTPAQRKRLKQLEWQALGSALFVQTPEIAQQLQLTDQQKAGIQEAYNAGRPQRAVRPADPDRQEKLAEAERATMEKIMALLTEEQQRKLREVLGPPLKLRLSTPVESLRARQERQDPEKVPLAKAVLNGEQARKEIHGAWEPLNLSRPLLRRPADAQTWDIKVNEIVITKLDPATKKETKSTWQYRIDPAKDYPQIDLMPGDGPAAGKTLKGIYRINHGILHIRCIAPTQPQPEGRERPAVFHTKEDGLVDFSLRRQQEKKDARQD